MPAQLRLMDLRPEPLEIIVPIRIYDGRTYERTEERAFKVRSDLPIDVLLGLRMYRDRIVDAEEQEAKARDELDAATQKGDADWITRAEKKVEKTGEASFQVIEEANQEIQALLREQNDLAAGERIVLSMQEIMGLIGFLANFREAITGEAEATVEEALEAAAEASEETREQEGREAPLPSRKRSSSGSSSSTSTSGSAPNGGSGRKSRGRRSSPTRRVSAAS